MNLTLFCFFHSAVEFGSAFVMSLFFLDMQRCYYIRSLADLKELFNDSNSVVDTDHTEQYNVN